MKPKYLNDIQSKVDALPYGDVNVKVTRVNRHTTKVTFTETQTLRYRDNTEAMQDVVDFLAGLVDSKHTGKVQFEVAIEEGQINLLAITNTGENKYGTNQ